MGRFWLFQIKALEKEATLNNTGNKKEEENKMYNKWVRYDGKGKWYHEEHPLDEVYKLTPEEEKDFLKDVDFCKSVDLEKLSRGGKFKSLYLQNVSKIGTF